MATPLHARAIGVGGLGTISPALPAFPTIWPSASCGANIALFSSRHAGLRGGSCLQWASRALFRRRRFAVLCSSSQRPDSMDLPLLPFQPEEVLVPSECKTLHLYEARFLALLEESLNKRENYFVHFVLDPIQTSGSSTGTSFAAKYGCLVIIENVEQLGIGALVSIRGIGRVTILDLVQTEPYLTGVVVPMQDKVFGYDSEINSKVAALRESLSNLNSLEIKLKVAKDDLLQTRIKSSLLWADKVNSSDYVEAFVPGEGERISFAALQPVSGSTQSELQTLQRRKLRAMTSRDTLERLSDGLDLIRDSIASVAAKLAIQSVEM